MHEHVNAFGDLQAILSQAAVDPEFTAELQKELAPFAAKTPTDLQELVPMLEQIRQGQLQGLIDGVAPGLLAHLAQEE